MLQNGLFSFLRCALVNKTRITPTNFRMYPPVNQSGQGLIPDHFLAEEETMPFKKPGSTSSRARHTKQILQQQRNTALSSKIQAAQSHPKTRHLITHYWTLHCTPERRNTAPPTRTMTQASLTRKPWQATCTNPQRARKHHNKENSTNCQNTERTPQTQQFKQDEETEEYPADKGTG